MSRTAHLESRFDPTELTIPSGHAWARLPLLGGALGLLGLVASLALAAGDPGQFYFSWLVAFLFYLTIALGGLFFVLTHYVTKASWSVVVRRMAEALTGSLPLFVPLFLPVLLGMPHLYHWTDAQAVAHDPLLSAKQGYLNPTFFTVRAAIYFVSWVGLTLWYCRRSAAQDLTGDIPTTLRLIRYSGPALFVFAFTVSFAGIDWVMSLDPHWYSTMFGVYFFSGTLVAIFAALSLLAVGLERAGLLRGTVTVEHLHDLGKLLFAFTVFWAYIGFSQYFLIWYGNIPEETSFFLQRAEGSWRTLTSLLAWGHFAVPFFFLMSRNVKRRHTLLVAGSLWMLAMHYVDVYWLVMPVHHPHGFAPKALDLTTFVGVGGLFVAMVGRALSRHALVPVRDPRLDESLGFENA